MNKINKNLPNILTLSRIALTPVVIALFLIPNGICKLIAFVVYLLASTTDWLDGYLARKYNLVSDMGKLLDASADKFLQTSALILVLTSEYNVVGLWISIIIMLVFLLRDSWMSTVRQLSASKGVIISADVWGKIKSILMDISMGALFLYSALCGMLKNGQNTKIFKDVTLEYLGCFGIVLLSISAVFCVLSCVNYTIKAWPQLVGSKSKDNSNEIQMEIELDKNIEGDDNSQK